MKENVKAKATIEKMLSKWEVSAPDDCGIHQNVLRRIRVSEAERRNSPPAFGRIMAFAGITVACLSLCTALLFYREISNRQNIRNYFLTIDPVAHAAERLPYSNDVSVVNMLAWMQDRFDLSREQFSELVALHESYSDRFEDLYVTLLNAEDRFSNFETSRISGDTIDFMALYDLLMERKELRANAENTSRDLIRDVLDVLTPEQRREYISLLKNTLPSDKDTLKLPIIDAGA